MVDRFPAFWPAETLGTGAVARRLQRSLAKWLQARLEFPDFHLSLVYSKGPDHSHGMKSSYQGFLLRLSKDPWSWAEALTGALEPLQH